MLRFEVPVYIPEKKLNFDFLIRWRDCKDNEIIAYFSIIVKEGDEFLVTVSARYPDISISLIIFSIKLLNINQFLHYIVAIYDPLV